MTVRFASDGAIMLEGVCPVDDAEPLRQLLQTNPGAAVDWGGCELAHTAVIQVLLVAGPSVRGFPRSAFLRDWIAPLFASSDAGITTEASVPIDPWSG